jgi:hypothetical protein
VGRAKDGDGGVYRASARDVDDAQGQAKHETVGLAGRAASAQPRERALEQDTERRDQVSEADQRQQRDTRVTKRVLRQVEQ